MDEGWTLTELDVERVLVTHGEPARLCRHLPLDGGPGSALRRRRGQEWVEALARAGRLDKERLAVEKMLTNIGW